MARRSRRRSANAVGGARSRYAIANRRLPPPIYLRPIDLRVFEDRRLFTPVRVVWPKAVRARAAVPARVTERPRGFSRQLGLSFVDSKRVVMCERRKRRREVLFAKGGLSSRSPKHRNEWSAVKC